MFHPKIKVRQKVISFQQRRLQFLVGMSIEGWQLMLNLWHNSLKYMHKHVRHTFNSGSNDDKNNIDFKTSMGQGLGQMVASVSSSLEVSDSSFPGWNVESISLSTSQSSSVSVLLYILLSLSTLLNGCIKNSEVISVWTDASLNSFSTCPGPQIRRMTMTPACHQEVVFFQQFPPLCKRTIFFSVVQKK